MVPSLYRAMRQLCSPLARTRLVVSTPAIHFTGNLAHLEFGSLNRSVI